LGWWAGPSYRKLGPDHYAVEVTAQIVRGGNVEVPATHFDLFSAAVLQTVASCKQMGRTVFHNLPCSSEVRRPVVQKKQNRVDLLSQRASLDDPDCSLSLKQRGCRELEHGPEVTEVILDNFHRMDGWISVDAISGGQPFTDGNNAQLCVAKPHFDMKSVEGATVTQGRVTLLKI
jgi:hypothetical protein